jgi:hemoglobin
VCETARVETLYDAIGGFDVLLRLCRRWHESCLADPVAAHPFEHDLHPLHDERLAAYLAEALGGPQLYTAGYGDETSMQRLHAGNGLHVELDERCLELFDRALADLAVPADPAAGLSAYFREATVAQRAYADGPDRVPEDLPFNIARG